MVIFAALIIMNWAADKLMTHIKYRYKWQCPEPGCIFRVSCSHKDLLEKVKEEHHHRHE